MFIFGPSDWIGVLMIPFLYTNFVLIAEFTDYEKISSK